MYERKEEGKKRARQGSLGATEAWEKADKEGGKRQKDGSGQMMGRGLEGTWMRERKKGRRGAAGR